MNALEHRKNRLFCGSTRTAKIYDREGNPICRDAVGCITRVNGLVAAKMATR